MDFDKLISSIRLFIEDNPEKLAAAAALIAVMLLLVLFYRSQNAPTAAQKKTSPIMRPNAGLSVPDLDPSAPLSDDPFAPLTPFDDLQFANGADHSATMEGASPLKPATITPASIAEQFAAIDALERGQNSGEKSGDQQAERPIATVDDPERRAALAQVEAELLSIRRLYQARLIAPEIYLLKSRQIAQKLTALSS